MQVITHNFEPVFNHQSKILILGTMPSPKSRENGFYYSHPQNKFWRVLAAVLEQPQPVTNGEKLDFLQKHRIALWDVLAACTIRGADDGSIRNPEANDLSIVLNQAPIQQIFTTGKKATQLYEKYCYPNTQLKAHYLPSTSPANCRYYTEADLIVHFREILPYLK